VLIVPERHTMFMATWATRLPARRQADRVPPHRRWHLIPGAHLSAAHRAALRDAMRSGHAGRIFNLHPDAELGVVLVDDSVWEAVLCCAPRIRVDEAATCARSS
jgi:hypothetical protein